VFRKGGEQCKAPAEKGSHICYAHAGQAALAARRERERKAVLTEAVAQMRRRGKPECEMADLFMDFKGVNVTLAVMAQALIDGRIDCKTAGRLVVQLQTVSKLLWLIHRKGREGRKGSQISPQICADQRRLGKPGQDQNLTAETQRHSPHQARTGLVGDPGGEQQKELPLINTDNADLREQQKRSRNRATNELEQTRIALVAKVLEIANGRGWAHAPPELLRAA
jgi:hypothetical protein